MQTCESARLPVAASMRATLILNLLIDSSCRPPSTQARETLGPADVICKFPPRWLRRDGHALGAAPSSLWLCRKRAICPLAAPPYNNRSRTELAASNGSFCSLVGKVFHCMMSAAPRRRRSCPSSSARDGPSPPFHTKFDRSEERRVGKRVGVRSGV